MAWAQRYEARGGFPQATAAGQKVAGLVLDIDATIVVCHSEKQRARPTWKRNFGYHSILAFLDNTNEALAGLLRPGNAGSNTAADHIVVLDRALAQIPDPHRYGTPILVRTDVWYPGPAPAGLTMLPTGRDNNIHQTSGPDDHDHNANEGPRLVRRCTVFGVDGPGLVAGLHGEAEATR